jgi:primosomal protein N' (replication factor Y)
VPRTPENPPERIARVALDAPLDRLFDYLARDATEADIGRRVEVPFGTRRRIGVLLALAEASELAPESLKPLGAIDRQTPPLPADLLALARFVANYYHHPLGAVLATLLPPALRRARTTRRPDPPLAYRLTQAGHDHVESLPARATAQVALARRLLLGVVPRADLADGEKVLLRDWLRREWVEAVTPAAMLADADAAGAAPELTGEQARALDDPGGRAAGLRGLAAARRHRQRQDRGLSAPGGGGPGA